jgi:hypothetical protein
MYYITVGKRKTTIELGSVTRCYEISRMLEHRLGRKVTDGIVRRATTEYLESRPMKDSDNAVRILNLIL